MGATEGELPEDESESEDESDESSLEDEDESVEEDSSLEEFTTPAAISLGRLEALSASKPHD